MTSRLSNLQFGTLKFFSTHVVDQDSLRALNNAIILSLVRRGLLVRNGNIVEPSKQGIEILDAFRNNDPARRMYERPVSEMVGRLLHLKHLYTMKKAS